MINRNTSPAANVRRSMVRQTLSTWNSVTVTRGRKLLCKPKHRSQQGSNLYGPRKVKHSVSSGGKDAALGPDRTPERPRELGTGSSLTQGYSNPVRRTLVKHGEIECFTAIGTRSTLEIRKRAHRKIKNELGNDNAPDCTDKQKTGRGVGARGGCFLETECRVLSRGWPWPPPGWPPPGAGQGQHSRGVLLMQGRLISVQRRGDHHLLAAHRRGRQRGALQLQCVLFVPEV